MICKLDTIDDVPEFFSNFAEWQEKPNKELTSIDDWLSSLFKVLPYPLTIIYEPYYVDRVYRDEYYRYYSSKHFGISRNCVRLVFLNQKYSIQDFLSSDESKHREIENNLVGAVVIKPTGTIGRTLINPASLTIKPCYIRTTSFEISVLGRLYSLQAFPFSGQDAEVMTCAEVNMWQIMEYFGSRYRNYRVMLPSEMLDCLNGSAETSILPSDGLSVEQEEFLFMKNGLLPKVYHRFVMIEDTHSVWIEPSYDDNLFYSILHVYVESGIPVLLNLREKNVPQGENHTVTCIGHEYVDFNNVEFVTNKNDIVIDKPNESPYNISAIPSWRSINQYVVMEDHSVPYQLQELESMKFGDPDKAKEWIIDSFVVPLYKHVFMPAEDAYDIFAELFQLTGNQVVASIGNTETQVVFRIFLTTSRAFKDFRVLNSNNTDEKIYYSQVSYPKFLWVCEYGAPLSYAKHRINGEFILDATAYKCGTVDSAVTIRHGEHITYRGPDELVENVHSYREDIELSKEYAMFEQNNLRKIEGRLTSVYR